MNYTPLKPPKTSKYDNLKKWNKRMAYSHGALATMIFVVAVTKGAPFVIKFERMWKQVDTTKLPEIVKQPYCPLQLDSAGQPTIIDEESEEYDSVFDWFECIREQLDTDGEEVWNDDVRARLYMYEPTLLFEMKVWVLLFVFELLTCFFHAALATCWRDTYEYYLNLKIQPFRWIEYSITSSIMLVAIFSLSRISDIYALSGMFLSSVFLCLCGGLLFELFDHLSERLLSEPTLISLLEKLKWTFFLLSWVAFILQYIYLFDAFYTAINPYFQLDSADLWRELFGFIQILNFLILFAYMTFPTLHLLQVSRTVQYHTAELGYMWLSLISPSLHSTLHYVGQALIVAHWSAKS